MQIKLLVEGGDMKPGPALGQKLGPIGLNVNQVIQKVNESTKDFKGMKVPVELEIDSGTKQFEVKVFSPPTSELLKKELGIEKGSGSQLKLKAANASIEQVISVAKSKQPNLLARDLKAAVRSIVGTCTSLGILIENKPATEVENEIEEGKYDEEISQEKTETSKEKRAKLDKYFSVVHSKEEKAVQQEEAEKEAAAAAKTGAKEVVAPETTEKKEEPKEESKE